MYARFVRCIHPLLRGIATSGDGRSKLGTSSFVLAVLLFIFTLLTFILCFYVFFIFVVPMLKCLGKRSCMSSTFPIVILNGTYSLCSAKTAIRSRSRGCSTKLWTNWLDHALAFAKHWRPWPTKKKRKKKCLFKLKTFDITMSTYLSWNSQLIISTKTNSDTSCRPGEYVQKSYFWYKIESTLIIRCTHSGYSVDVKTKNT